MTLERGEREELPLERDLSSEKETDLQCAYRLQKYLKDTKRDMELARIEYDGCINRIQRSGDLTDGTFELVNQPRKYWVIDPAKVKEKYPNIYKALVEEINDTAKTNIKALDIAMPVMKVKDALRSIGIQIQNKVGIWEGDLSGVAIQVPEDKWIVVDAFKKKDGEGR